MTVSTRTPFVWVKDKAGNEFICPLEALKDAKKSIEGRTEELYRGRKKSASSCWWVVEI